MPSSSTMSASRPKSMSHLTVPTPDTSRSSTLSNGTSRRSSSSTGLTNQRPSSTHSANLRSRSTTRLTRGRSLETPTDQSDTTEDEFDTPVECSGHDHLDYPVVDQVIEIPVDTMYQMIFSDHEFYKHFQRVKKTTDLEMTEWSEPDSEGDQVRPINYTIALNHPMGPKHASTAEKQYLRHHWREGSCYVVDAEAYTTGVPYGESFYLLNRFCMTRVNSRSTRLKITCNIIYLKKVWGLIKNFIEKNVKTGTVESYILLAKLLQEEADKLVIANNPGVQRKKRLRHHKSEHTEAHTEHTQESTPTDTTQLHSQNVPEVNNNNNVHSKPKRHKVRDGASHSKSKNRQVDQDDASSVDFKVNVTTLAKFVFILVILLVLINIGLFYKLSEVQEKANILTKHRQDLAEMARLSDVKGQWQPLLNDQQKQHESDMSKWNDVISASAQIMDTMHNTLLELQANIVQHQTMSKEMYGSRDSGES